MVKIGNDWDEILKDEFLSENYQNLRKKLISEYKSYTIYPPMDMIFNAFKLTAYKDVKAVILGQDPYHNYGEAEGLCFSVPESVKHPPSLQNIFKELKGDIGASVPVSGSLRRWAEQGALLLNTSLTVRENSPNSHSGFGWALFTDNVISIINKNPAPVVFILWGANARQKKYLLTNQNHYIIESAHPSPLSCNYGFFGSRPFSRANEFLKGKGVTPIEW